MDLTYMIKFRGVGGVGEVGKYLPKPQDIKISNFSKIIKQCRDPGLNQGPSDLQSDALPTELSRLAKTFIHQNGLLG